MRFEEDRSCESCACYKWTDDEELCVREIAEAGLEPSSLSRAWVRVLMPEDVDRGCDGRVS